MTLRTPEETAIVLALLLKRSGQGRARISEKTMRLAARRKRLRGAFIVLVTPALADRGWCICELESGGFGVIQSKALEAAKAVTMSKYLTTEERVALKRPDFNFDDLEEEARLVDEEDEPSDTD